MTENYRLLKEYHPNLADKIITAEEFTAINFVKGSQGEVIPAFGQNLWYSADSPQKEGEQALKHALHNNNGTVLFLGFGAGYQIEPFLEAAAIRKIIVLDNAFALQKAVFSQVNLTKLLVNPKLHFIYEEDSALAIAKLKQFYQPLRDGTMLVFSLSNIIEYNKNFYINFNILLAKYIKELKEDIAAQGYFGKLWFKNIVHNLINFKNEPLIIEKWPLVAIIGAGPSLNGGILKLKEVKEKGGLLIACDTALTTLMAYNIIPDIVLTTNPQSNVAGCFVGYSNYNFKVLADLVSAPAVMRGFKTTFFAGNHPLSRLSGLSTLDTMGDNIGYTALALAYALGAEQVMSVGLDFAYPNGQIYAKNSCFCINFYSEANRLKTVYRQNWDLLWQDKDIKKIVNGDDYLYQSKLFKSYQEQFKLLKNEGLSKQVWYNSNINAAEFLHNYKVRLENLATK